MGSSSLNRDQTQVPYIANHWTSKKVPFFLFFFFFLKVNLTQALSWAHASEHLHIYVLVFFSIDRHLPFQTQPKHHLVPSLSSQSSFKTMQYSSEILQLGPQLPKEASGRGVLN